MRVIMERSLYARELGVIVYYSSLENIIIIFYSKSDSMANYLNNQQSLILGSLFLFVSSSIRPFDPRRIVRPGLVSFPRPTSCLRTATATTLKQRSTKHHQRLSPITLLSVLEVAHWVLDCRLRPVAVNEYSWLDAAERTHQWHHRVWEPRSRSWSSSKESSVSLRRTTFLLMILTGPGFVSTDCFALILMLSREPRFMLTGSCYFASSGTYRSQQRTSSVYSPRQTFDARATIPCRISRRYYYP